MAETSKRTSKNSRKTKRPSSRSSPAAGQASSSHATRSKQPAKRGVAKTSGPSRAGKRAAGGSGSSRTPKKAASAAQRPPRQSRAAGRQTAERRSQTSSAGRRSNGVTAADAVDGGRRQLSQLLGRPVEGMLGVAREDGHWVVTAQVLELARIPNTTDVLAEYEAVLDRNCEVVSYKRTRRYHRGAVDSGQ
jgi:Gas vesicle synthesis protein GvpO